MTQDTLIHNVNANTYGYAYPTSTLRKVVPLSCLLVLTIRSQHYFFESLNITSSLVLKAPRPTAYYNITSSLVLKAPWPTAYYTYFANSSPFCGATYLQQQQRRCVKLFYATETADHIPSTRPSTRSTRMSANTLLQQCHTT